MNAALVSLQLLFVLLRSHSSQQKEPQSLKSHHQVPAQRFVTITINVHRNQHQRFIISTTNTSSYQTNIRSWPAGILIRNENMPGVVVTLTVSLSRDNHPLELLLIKHALSTLCLSAPKHSLRR